MTATLLLAGALLAQAAPATVPASGELERADVAYAAMSEGRTEAAIDQLRTSARNDPAALINLGTAYARMGMRQQAAEAFTAALASSERYELQLADGSWMDSRRAARAALARLEKSSTLATR
jgi:tetratricopeptide (TPR) repeat protein